MANSAAVASSEPVQPARVESPNSRAPVQAWRGKQIGEQIHSRSIDAAYRSWLFHRATRQPRLRDLADNMTPVDNTLLTMRLNGEYLIVGQSDAYIGSVGRDLRGCLTSELKFATANSLRELYDESLSTQKPIYARYISSLSEKHTYWECLIVPLSADGRSKPIFALNYMATLSDKVDVLQILFDRSLIGMLAAVPIMDGRNKTEDARVLTLNPKAREILSIAPERTVHTVGELLHYIRDELKWSIKQTVSEGKTTIVKYLTPSEKEIAVAIELINQFILISITEQVHEEEQASPSRFARLLGLTS
jgi:hypothetical protein